VGGVSFQDKRIWLARLLIFAVVAWNLQVAYVFFRSPQSFVAGFELSGTAGEAALRGMGVLFAMWNVPYLVALAEPRRYRVSLFEAMAMQFIGLAGESYIFGTLGAENVLLRASVLRFMIFDSAGLLFLLGAFFCSRKNPHR
jgi:hypothetical protein